MKNKIFILPLLLGPMSAFGYDISVYYDSKGNCDTLCSVPYAGTGCCPDQSVVTEQMIAEKFKDLAMAHDEEFKGFKLPDETELMDAEGNLKLTGRQINAMGLDSSVTLRTTNTCTTGSRNNNNACVSSAYVYVDDNGEVIAPEDVSFEKGAAECAPIQDFQVRFHPVPTKNYNNCPNPPYGYFGKQWCSFSPQNITEFASNLISSDGTKVGVYPFDPGAANQMGLNNYLQCNTADGCFTLYHCGNSNKHTPGWYTDANCSVPVGNPKLPEIAGYSLRGYYGYTFNYMANDHSLHMITDLVTESNTTLGAPWANRLVTNGTSLNLGAANLKVIKCAVQFPDGKIPENTLQNVVIDVFGGWARDCANVTNGTCNRTIYTAQSGAYGVGDVSYTNGCDDGYHLSSTTSTYNPSCVPDSTGQHITLRFKNLTSSTCDFSTGSQTWSCETGTTENMPAASLISCASGYAIAGWQTATNQVYDLGASYSCSQSVLGVSSGEASITALICDCNSAVSPADRCYNVCGASGGGKGSDWLEVKTPD